MTNWQERINSEIDRRRELQASVPTQKPFNATDYIKERQRIEGEEAMRKLKPEDLRALSLLDRLGVKHMLEEIRDEVWGGNGTITQESHAFEAWVGKRINLVFLYKYPKPVWTCVYDTKFGYYTEVHSQSNMSMGGSEYTTSYSERKFGRHELESGYRNIESYSLNETGEYITISVIKDYSGFVLELPHYNKFKLNPQALDEAGAKKFIEQSLLDDCTERKQNKFLPTDILERVKHNEAIIQQAIGEKRRFRFEKGGETSMEPSLGLVKAYR